jgi:hypothetical protein
MLSKESLAYGGEALPAAGSQNAAPCLTEFQAARN